MQHKHDVTPPPAALDVPWHPTPRVCNLVCGIACVLLLLYGYYLEIFLNLPPCPLCVLQRFVIALLGIAFLAAAMQDPKRRAARVYGGYIAVVAAIGVSIAGRHVWLVHMASDGAETCLPGLGYLLNALPIAETLRLVLLESGNCGGTVWSFLGLSIPEWTLIAFIGFGVIGATVNWSAGKRAN